MRLVTGSLLNQELSMVTFCTNLYVLFCSEEQHQQQEITESLDEHVDKMNDYLHISRAQGTRISFKIT